MWSTRSVMQVLNALAATVLYGVVFGAFFIQFADRELPCPLCLLIRLGMLGAAFGLALNAFWGPKPLHYGISLLGAVLGAAISLRQVALHVVPGTGSYGAAVLGFHLYTWAFIVFAVLILAIGAVVCFQRQFDEEAGESPAFASLAGRFAVVVGLALCLANVVAVGAECDVRACPDNPTHYEGPLRNWEG